MGRINEQIPEIKFRKSPSSIYLRELIYEIITSYSASPEINYDDKKIKKEAKLFFENYYVAIDTSGKITIPEIDIKKRLSTHESYLLNYILNPKDSSKIFGLLGHAGVGKSTLLKYIIHYLYFSEQNLRNLFFPVYIALSDELGEIRNLTIAEELFRFLDNQIYLNSRQMIYNYLSEPSNAEKALMWVNTNSKKEFFGKFPPNAISTITNKGIDNYIKELHQDDTRDLFLDILHYYTQSDNPSGRRVVIFIDNVDRFNLDIHRLCLAYADKKINQSFKSVLAMRVSSYYLLDEEISEKLDNITPPLTYTVDAVKAILTTRIYKSRQIRLKSTFTISVDSERLVHSFIDLLSTDESLDTFVHLSNQNLHLLFRKLQIMTESEYFSDALLQKEFLQSQLNNPRHKGAPLWILYSLLFGNFHGTFRSQNRMATASIINVFCNQDSSRRPYTFFSRLHILCRVYAFGTVDEEYVKVKNIYEEYRLLFGEDIHFTETFYRTIYRLIQGSLIFTKSCRSYTNPRDVENLVLTDEITISDTGRFYLKQLITKIDYLYFMKDDINWLGSIDFGAAKVELSRNSKFIYTLQALKKLMELEYQMLQRIQIQSTDGETNVIGLYIGKFSPYQNMEENQFVFTQMMYREMVKYIKKVDPGFFEINKQQKQELKNLSELNNELEKAFIPR